MPATPTSAAASTPAGQDIAGQYIQVPFTDNLGDDPSGQTFNVFQLVSDPGERAFRITNPTGRGERRPRRQP